MKITYNKNLKQLARKLRNKSTQSEIRLWKFLKGKRMMGYDFHRQKPIDRFIADFFCNKLKLVIELDGYTHDFEEVQNKDLIKTRRLNRLGLTVLRFKDEEVMRDIDNVLRSIELYIEEFEKDTPLPAAGRLSPLIRGEKGGFKKSTVKGPNTNAHCGLSGHSN